MARAKAKILTKIVGTQESDISPLARVPNLPFRMSIERVLDNRYQFIDMKPNDIKKFHGFIEATVGKKLSISQVDKQFLRKRGLSKSLIKEKIDGVEREVFHYGKNAQPFRVYGYYNSEHFVLKRIDCKHKTHN